MKTYYTHCPQCPGACLGHSPVTESDVIDALIPGSSVRVHYEKTRGQGASFGRLATYARDDTMTIQTPPPGNEQEDAGAMLRLLLPQGSLLLIAPQGDCLDERGEYCLRERVYTLVSQEDGTVALNHSRDVADMLGLQREQDLFSSTLLYPLSQVIANTSLPQTIAHRLGETLWNNPAAYHCVVLI